LCLNVFIIINHRCDGREEKDHSSETVLYPINRTAAYLMLSYHGSVWVLYSFTASIDEIRDRNRFENDVFCLIFIYIHFYSSKSLFRMINFLNKINRTLKKNSHSRYEQLFMLTIPPGHNFHNKRNTEAIPGMFIH